MNQKNIKASLIVLVALAFSTNVYTMNTELENMNTKLRKRRVPNLTLLNNQKNHEATLINLENVYPEKPKIKTRMGYYL